METAQGPHEEAQPVLDDQARARRVATDSLVLTICATLAAALGALFSAYSARKLGPAAFGEMTAGLALIGAASALLSPVEVAVARAVAHGTGARDRLLLGEAVSSTFALLTRLSLAVLIICAAASVPLVRLLHLYPAIALAIGAVLLASTPVALLRGLQRGANDFTALGVAQLIDAAVRLLCGAFLLHAGAGAAGALSAYAVGLVCGGAVAWFSLRELPRRDRATSPSGSGVKIGTDLALLYLQVQLLSTIDVIAARRFLSPRDAGLYGAAVTLARLVSMGIGPLQQILFSSVVVQHARGGSSARLLLQVGTPLAGLLGLSVLIPLLFGEWILNLAFGASFVAAAPVLTILWIASVCLAAQSMIGFALLGAAALGQKPFWLLIPLLAEAGLIALYHRTAREMALCALAASGLGLASLLRPLLRYARGR